jgi:hypothetical protein
LCFPFEHNWTCFHEDYYHEPVFMKIFYYYHFTSKCETAILLVKLQWQPHNECSTKYCIKTLCQTLFHFTHIREQSQTNLYQLLIKKGEK